MSVRTSSLMSVATKFIELFGSVMLVNYLTHGINILRNPALPVPRDALTAVFESLISSDALRSVHSSTNIAAGLYGALKIVSQVQTLAATGAGSSSASSSQPSSTSLGI